MYICTCMHCQRIEKETRERGAVTHTEEKDVGYGVHLDTLSLPFGQYLKQSVRYKHQEIRKFKLYFTLGREAS